MTTTILGIFRVGTILASLGVVIGCFTETDTASRSSARSEVKADYAAARAKFHTRLLHRGPSPAPPSAVHFSLLNRPEGVEQVEYSSANLALVAWLQSPDNSEQSKLPAVVFLHGGWGFDETDWKHTSPFLDAGFVVLAPMLRGENGNPGNFTMFYDEVDDVTAAGTFLAGLPNVDSQQIYLCGYSAGGTLAMLAAMTSNPFRAVAALDGSPDRRSFVRGFIDDVPFAINDENELRMRSPIDFPTSFKRPTRLYCSIDAGADFETQQLATSARAHGLDVEMVAVEGDHHGFREPATKLAIDFFRRNGKDGKRSEP